MRVRATLRIRNEAMIAGRERFGLTQASLAELAGVSQCKVSALERLDFKGWNTRQEVDRIAGILEVDPLEIMPIEAEGERFETTVSRVADIDVLRLSSVKCLSLPSHEAEVDDADLRTAISSEISKVLNTLSYREREVIKLRYGLCGGQPHSLREVGHILGVSVERIRQIEGRAVGLLQEPERIEPLREFAEELL